MKWNVLMVSLLVLGVLPAKTRSEDPLPRPGLTMVFLGDSITAAGHFIDHLETWSVLNRQQVPEMINLGLASETVSGLSEKHHPFPRPDLHDRLERVLSRTTPDVVVACYGINCGIYHPFSPERFAAYQQGIRKLIRQAHEAGSKVILLTPPPYAGMVNESRGAADGADFGYKTPYPRYDEVMARYADWIHSLEQQEKVRVVDVRTPLLENLQQAYDRDPIHPNRTGHETIARAFLEEWAGDLARESYQTDQRWDETLKLVNRRRQALDKALLDEIGHNRPGTKAKYSLGRAEEIAAEIDRELAELRCADSRTRSADVP